MAFDTVLATNNPLFLDRALPVRYSDVSAMEVLLAARDLIHEGWVLRNHPLYGNFRPYQQPFRSLLLDKPHDGLKVDEYSLSLIESALEVYRSCEKMHVTPETAPKVLYDDASVIDFELMRETLSKSGLLR